MKRSVTRILVIVGALSLGYGLLAALQHVGLLSDYHVQILVWVGINAIMGVSLNLINGFTGQFSLGHAGFMAIGAYVAAYCTKIWAMPFAVALVFGGLAAAVGGLGVGIPTLRLSGDYLAIATLGFGEIIRVAILNLDVVGGPRGLPGIPAHTSLLWVYCIVVLTVFVVKNLIWSKHGRAFVAIREDETAAETMGIDTTSSKIAAFVIGAFFAGVAGGLYAHKITYIDPSQFDFMKSVEALLIVVLGGMGSLTGSVVASFIVTLLPELLRPLADWRMVVYALLLILIMLYRPKGLMGASEFGLSSLGLGDDEPDPGRGSKRRPKEAELPPIIETRAVSASFGGLKAVSDLNMVVRSGEMTALIGPNGAGKTTVFNMLTGLVGASEGHILYKGKSITNKRPSEINSMGIARTFQNIRLFNNMTVIENVMIALNGQHEYSMAEAVLRAGRYEQAEEEIRARAMDLLRVFGLDDRAHEIASRLPYGDQRRLEIARALATNPHILLLDEPAAGMNPQETSELLDLIRWVRDKYELTILLIEHDMKLVMNLCERIIVLDHGMMIADGPPSEVVRNRRVVEAYLGEEAV